MSELEPLIRALASGESLRNTEIASAQVDELQDLGLDVVAHTDGHYGLSAPLELLAAASIRNHLTAEANKAIGDVECHLQIDSTNTRLMTMPASLVEGRLCLAESQTAGRGRRGRSWQSPFGQNIYMSLGWRVPKGIAIPGISLVVGMAIANALRTLGYRHIGLKWPNDVLVSSESGSNGKLAGILLEMGPPVGGDHIIVIGVGLNVEMSESASTLIDQPYATLKELTPEAVAGTPLPEFSRNLLTAAIMNTLIPDLVRYSSQGFAPFAPLWAGFDLYIDRQIFVRIADQQTTGIHRGIDQEGQLIVDIDGLRRTFNAGEVSLRAADPALNASRL
tara:strand:- start:1556 stop:2560 length:1005 start_codon:yes stop_codon:yes gene_type:complete